MIKVPSAACAAITGLLFTPLLVVGLKYIEQNKLRDAAFVIWAVLTFFAPVAISVADFSYWWRQVRERRNIFALLVAPDDFKHFYVPAWGRMFVWFVASVASMTVLTFLGVVQ